MKGLLSMGPTPSILKSGMDQFVSFVLIKVINTLNIDGALLQTESLLTESFTHDLPSESSNAPMPNPLEL